MTADATRALLRLDTILTLVVVALDAAQGDGSEERCQDEQDRTTTEERSVTCVPEGGVDARLLAVQTRVGAAVTSRSDRMGGRVRRWVRRAWRAVEGVRPLGVLDTVDRHDLVRVTRSRLRDSRVAGRDERNLGGADTGLGRRVDHNVHALAGRVRATRDDISRDRILGDTWGAIQGTGWVDRVITHATAVVEPDVLGRHRRNGGLAALERRDVELEGLAVGRHLVPYTVLPSVLGLDCDRLPCGNGTAQVTVRSGDCEVHRLVRLGVVEREGDRLERQILVGVVVALASRDRGRRLHHGGRELRELGVTTCRVGEVTHRRQRTRIVPALSQTSSDERGRGNELLHAGKGNRLRLGSLTTHDLAVPDEAGRRDRVRVERSITGGSGAGQPIHVGFEHDCRERRRACLPYLHVIGGDGATRVLDSVRPTSDPRERHIERASKEVHFIGCGRRREISAIGTSSWRTIFGRPHGGVDC